MIKYPQKRLGCNQTLGKWRNINLMNLPKPAFLECKNCFFFPDTQQNWETLWYMSSTSFSHERWKIFPAGTWMGKSYHVFPLVMFHLLLLRGGGWKYAQTQPQRCWNELGNSHPTCRSALTNTTRHDQSTILSIYS